MLGESGTVVLVGLGDKITDNAELTNEGTLCLSGDCGIDVGDDDSELVVDGVEGIVLLSFGLFVR